MLFNFTFEGNLADAPELRITPSGKALCRMRVGHNTRRRTTSGEWVNGPTMWVTVTAWETLAERCADLRKGDTIVVDARDDLTAWPFLAQGSDKPGAQLQVTAANISLSLRFNPAASSRPARTNEAGDFADAWAHAEPADDLQPAL
ncbi:single-stranded DNA-binding protein [Catenuloplanes indicus]|uniref:Single-strand DNA-binding protein n=1 Tax=Catenuloplanes indicus TaxID=137267 RepID=A0AAE4AYL4_9ACTN|nr:single-stranded DNA-binding protein [Catenuloplanes indicus]MDQ0366871.1 single-strand DNA-binding protein [Catenuloplanes indicus]